MKISHHSNFTHWIPAVGKFLSVLVLVTAAGSVRADDWPRWRGPNLDGISKETGWSSTWPKSGPKQLWKASVGTGFSSMSVANGRVYTMGNQKDTDTVYCFDAEKGTELWKHSYPSKLDPKYYEGGTSSTPTVDGDKVYTMGRFGDVFCLDAATGKVHWSKNLVKELGLKIPTWGFAGSPLIDGNVMYLKAGTAGLALNKADGKVIWTTGVAESGYATPVPFNFKGQKTLAVFGAVALYAVNPQNGKIQWQFPWTTEYEVNAADPIVSDQLVFLSSGYNTGGGLVDLKSGKPSKVWASQAMHNQLSPSVLINGHLYGVNGQSGQKGDLRCVELATGKVKWQEPSVGLGALTAADGKLIVLGEKGELIVAEATPTAFKPLSRAQVLGGKNWTVPVLANGRIYCRNSRGDLVCVDVRQ